MGNNVCLCVYAGFSECDECGICGYTPAKTIQCPQCGVMYEVEFYENNTTQCQDCGAEYLQRIHDVENKEYIRQAAYRCRG
jgi:uncharacterized paraquat-inducible protein A